MKKQLWRHYLCMQERLAIIIATWRFGRHALEVKGSRSLNTLGIISWQKQHQQSMNSPNILGRRTVLLQSPYMNITSKYFKIIQRLSKATLAMYNCAYQGFYRSALKLLPNCPMPASPRIPNLLVVTGTALPHSKQGILQWLLPRWPEYHCHDLVLSYETWKHVISLGDGKIKSWQSKYLHWIGSNLFMAQGWGFLFHGLRYYDHPDF